MADVQVTCINKQPSHTDPHHGITHLGGTGWHWTRAQVIDSIENRTYSFYVQSGGKRSEVGVVSGPHGKYLRTHADGYWNDNLLALPECL
jgi:hypothetical protein